MTGPRIGPEAPEWQEGRCAYAADEQSIACMRDAVWHGISSDGKGMLCCDLHNPIMAVLARWVHAVEVACTVPEGRFFEEENRCSLRWDHLRVPFAAEAVAALRRDTQ